MNTLRSVANGKFLGYNWGPFADPRRAAQRLVRAAAVQARGAGRRQLRPALRGLRDQESWFGATPTSRSAPTAALTLGSPAPRAPRTSPGRSSAAASTRRSPPRRVPTRRSSWSAATRSSTAGRRTTAPRLALGEGQEALVRAVLKANPRTIVVLQTSYPDTITWEQEHVPAIVWTTHAGAETGHAIADVLFGDVQPGRAAHPDLVPLGRPAAGRPQNTTSSRPGRPTSTARTSRSTRSATGCPTPSSATARRTRRRRTVTVDVTNTGPAGRRRGRPALHPPAHLPGQDGRQAAARLPAGHLAAGRARTVTSAAEGRRPGPLGRHPGQWVVESVTHDSWSARRPADIRQRATLRVPGETIPARDLTVGRPGRRPSTPTRGRSAASTRARPAAPRWAGRRRATGSPSRTPR